MQFTKEQSEFIDEYVKCLKSNCASVFIGSGLSYESGYKTWSGFLKNYAKDIGLNINREKFDLISLAQYYVNSKKESDKLKKDICNEFKQGAKHRYNKKHLLLSSLPLASYWTTNYDTLIEQVLDYRDLNYNKIVQDIDLRKNDNSKPIWVYKMHGDIGNYQSIVITKQDYENYYDNNEMMLAKLKSEICTKTFLFIGYSISDPNIMHILARERRVFDKQNGRKHFAIMENVKRTNKNGKANRAYDYELNKLNHRIRDLEEYGVKVVLVDAYNQIEIMLQEIINRVYGKNVLISGAYEKETKRHDEIGKLCENISTYLISHNYKIFTGYGKNLGQHIVAGAFAGSSLRSKDEDNVLQNVPDIVSINQRVVNNFNNKVFIFPFPYNVEMGQEVRKDLYHRLRINMIASTQITIIFAGEKYAKGDIDSGIITSGGVMEEFEISQQQGNRIIPVAQTGGAAAEIWEKLKDNEDKFYSSKSFRMLKEALNYEELYKAILDCIKY